MSPCPTDDELCRLLDGRLDPAQGEQVATHLNNCLACQTHVERLTALGEAERSSLLTVGTTPPPVRPPLDGYTDWRELGRGGYAVVYRAVEVATGETVAVKLLRAGRDATPVEAERFRIEAVAAASLNHPHVVKILRVGEPATVPHFVMEYLPGGSLADALDGTPQSPRTAAELVRTIAAAIHEAHTRGIIHRDLKPGNVLLPDGTNPFAGAKVADFGMAKRLDGPDDRTPTLAVVGTPAYMAPEQAFGQSGQVGPPADVYSLGAILYELLTGRPPFRGATPYETLLQVRSHDPVPPRQLRPDLPVDLERVCLKCLEKCPDARYPSAAELSDELGRFLAGQSVRVRPLGVLSRGSRWVRRHPVTAVAIFAGVVTALAVASAGVSALEADERAKRVLREQEAGELLLKGGSLGDTIHRLDALVAEGIPLSDRHRLLLVEALIETNNLDRATTELDRMATPVISAEHRGRAALWRAEIALLKQDPAAVALIAAARSASLSPDDAAYADALLAETVPDAVRHLELAVGLNSRHVQARCLLAHLLLVGGRVDDAVRVAEQSRVIFTDHPTFPRVLAVAYAFRGESAKAQASLDVLAGLRPADEVRPVRAVVSAAAYAPRKLRAMLYGPEYGHQGVTDAEWVRLVEAQRECEAAGARWLAEMRLPPAVRPSVAAVFRAFGRVVMGLPPGETRVIPADELDDFGDVVRRLPEGVATMLYGHGLLEKANATPEGAIHTNTYCRRLEDAADVFRSAADRPGWMDVRDVALVNAAVFYSVAGKPRRPPPVTENAEWLAASAEAARLRWQLGKLTAEKLVMLIRVSANGGRFALGRAMLDDLGRMPGQEVVAEKSRADLELKAGDHRVALVAAEKVLKSQPDDAAAKQVVIECHKALGLPPGQNPEPSGGSK